MISLVNYQGSKCGQQISPLPPPTPQLFLTYNDSFDRVEVFNRKYNDKVQILQNSPESQK